MLPDAFVFPVVFVVESVATFPMDKTVALATVIDHDHPQFGIDLALTVPVAAGCAHFDFGGDDQFWAHNRQSATLNDNQSTVFTNGSSKVFI